MTDSHDTKRYRATYRKTYPTEPVSITKEIANPVNFDRDNFQKKIVTFECGKLTLSGYRVTNCNFYPKPIKDVTFKECHFRDCFLATRYLNVHFTDCSFSSCDFMRARFEECIFTNCSFQNCSAFDIRFETTSIDPTTFLLGVPFLEDNYVEYDSNRRRAERKRFVSTRLQIAATLLHSARTGKNSEFHDAAVYHYKKLDNQHRLYRLTTKEEIKRIFKVRSGRFAALRSYAGTWCRWFLESISLSSTAGGTSLLRLIAIFAFCTFALYPLMFETMSIRYHGEICEVTKPLADCFASPEPTQQFLGRWWEKVLASTELFLAFGFTSFKAENTLTHTLLVLQTGATVKCCV